MYDKDFFGVPPGNQENPSTDAVDQLKADLLDGTVEPQRSHSAYVSDMCHDTIDLRTELVRGFFVPLKADMATTADTATQITGIPNNNLLTTTNFSSSITRNYVEMLRCWKPVMYMTSGWKLDNSHIGALLVLKPATEILGFTFYLMSTNNAFANGLLPMPPANSVPSVTILNMSPWNVTINNEPEMYGKANIFSVGLQRTIQPFGWATLYRIGEGIQYDGLIGSIDIWLIGALQAP